MTEIPKEASGALEVIEELLGSGVAGVYLYGSAVAGGLRHNSDVDILALINHGLSEETRRSLADRLMLVSGKIGNRDAIWPLEVTVINYNDIVPWKYPPKKEFVYGEWLRTRYEQGPVPGPAYDPDLAIILYQVRNQSVALMGHDAAEILEPIPAADIRKAMRDSLPELLKNLRGDERNVILTLARMWVTAATGDILPKDAAAQWARPRLAREQGELLDIAAKAYRGECVDEWGCLEAEVAALVDQMKKGIESSLI